MTSERQTVKSQAPEPASEAGMDFVCYLHPGWEPLIRRAPATRDWMDASPEAFAYRCLPLNIANAHGWEILTPFAFEAMWNGGTTTTDVSIRLGPAGTSACPSSASHKSRA